MVLLLLLLLLLLLQELEGSLKSAPGKLYALKCDITKEEDIKEAFKWVKNNLGGVDILVNNAAGDRSNSLCGNYDITSVYSHLAVPPVLLAHLGDKLSSATVAG
jgi:NAD(P)-dependent dehydrogenase (short-subunit alcohol dehydrogenase family)